MNKEKQAMKELKHYGNMTSYYKEREYTDIQIGKYINIVLNLIDKQQKEIEELKSDRDYYKEMYYKIAFPEEEIRVKGLGVD